MLTQSLAHHPRFHRWQIQLLLLCTLFLLPTVAHAAPYAAPNTGVRDPNLPDTNRPTATLPLGWRQIRNESAGFQLALPPQWEVINLSANDVAASVAVAGELFEPLQQLFASDAFQQQMAAGMKLYALDLSENSLTALLPATLNIMHGDTGLALSAEVVRQVTLAQLKTVVDPNYPLTSETIEQNDHTALLFQYKMAADWGLAEPLAMVIYQKVLLKGKTQSVLTISVPAEAADRYSATIEQLQRNFTPLRLADLPIQPTPRSLPTPTVTPPAPPSHATATVQVETLNIRSGPGTNYARIDAVTRGQQLTVMGQVQNCRWLQVQLNANQLAWVAGPPQYTQLNQSCTAIPVITTIPTAPPPPPPAQPCVRFDNHFGKEAHVTLRIPDNHEWNQEFTIPPHGKETRCLAAGRYTASVNVPPIGDANDEFTLDRGTLVTPIQ